MARGSIRQRSKVRKDSWALQIYKGRDLMTGKKRYYCETVRGTKAVAERRLTELLRQMDRGTLVGRTSLLVGEFLDEWLEGQCVTAVRSATANSYRQVVERYLKRYLGHLRLVKLTAVHVVAMEARLLKDGPPGGRPLATATVRHCHQVLSSALSYAVRTGLVPVNVAKAASPPRNSRCERAVLDWGDVQVLLDAIGSDKFRWVVLLALQTGMRRSELGALQWGDINFDTRTISVRRGLARGESGMILGPPKSGKSRVIDIPDVAVQTLRSIRDREDYVGAGHFVFAQKDGRFPNIGRWTRLFKEYCRSVGLENVRFHDLRHTHASLLLIEGVHLKVVSERLGHASINITGDLYSHVMPTVQREAADRFGASLEAALGGGTS